MRVEQARLRLGVLGEVEVVAGGESLARCVGSRDRAWRSRCGRTRPARKRRPRGRSRVRLADDLGVAAERLDVGVLELPEVVLALGPSRAERDCRVGLAVDVRHAPLVAVNDDLTGEIRSVESSGGRRRRRDQRREGDEERDPEDGGPSHVPNDSRRQERRGGRCQPFVALSAPQRRARSAPPGRPPPRRTRAGSRRRSAPPALTASMRPTT